VKGTVEVRKYMGFAFVGQHELQRDAVDFIVVDDKDAFVFDSALAIYADLHDPLLE